VFGAPTLRMALRLVLAFSSVGLLASCAVDGGTPGSGSNVGSETGPARAIPTSAARMSLAPALRPFYDELEPYGDWVLAEPHGWVFRPRVNTVAWRPYQDGHWEPSYAFGWVWESNEPFGWITDHYGFWFHDDFQGWVWQPYGAWAPAWVAWVQVGNYVGWAPLGPDGSTGPAGLQGGVFTYVPAAALDSPGSSLHVSFITDLPDDGSELRTIDRVGTYHGATYNAGPDLEQVLGLAGADKVKLAEKNGTPNVTPPPVVRGAVERTLDLPELEQRTRRMWTEGRREFENAHAARLGRGGAGRPPAPETTPARPPGGPDSLRFNFGRRGRGPWGTPKGGVRQKPQHAAEDSLRTAKPDSLKLR